MAILFVLLVTTSTHIVAGTGDVPGNAISEMDKQIIEKMISDRLGTQPDVEWVSSDVLYNYDIKIWVYPKVVNSNSIFDVVTKACISYLDVREIFPGLRDLYIEVSIPLSDRPSNSLGSAYCQYEWADSVTRDPTGSWNAESLTGLMEKVLATHEETISESKEPLTMPNSMTPRIANTTDTHFDTIDTPKAAGNEYCLMFNFSNPDKRCYRVCLNIPTPVSKPDVFRDGTYLLSSEIELPMVFTDHYTDIPKQIYIQISGDPKQPLSPPGKGRTDRNLTVGHMDIQGHNATYVTYEHDLGIWGDDSGITSYFLDSNGNETVVYGPRGWLYVYLDARSSISLFTQRIPADECIKLFKSLNVTKFERVIPPTIAPTTPKKTARERLIDAINNKSDLSPLMKQGMIADITPTVKQSVLE